MSSASIKGASSFVLFFALVVGGGLAIGGLFEPGPWYAALNKPSYNPPNWAFPLAWSALYILIAIAGWRTWRRDRGGAAMVLWWLQLVLNFAWTPIFFGAHAIAAALGVLVLLLVAIAAFIAASWRSDRVAACLFIPYGAWVAFAGAINAALLVLN
ncbi:MAG: TspO/MBR family protein [Hyphomonadaceae bacterium]